MQNRSSLISNSSTRSLKRIPTDKLRPGMFLVSIEESWWKSPFFRHKRLIKNQQEIDLLKQSGILEVFIDTSRGLDIDDGEEHDPKSIAPTEASVFTQEAAAEAQAGRIQIQDRLGEEASSQPQESTPQEAAHLVREEAILAVESIFEGVKTGIPINQPLLRNTVNKVLEQVLTQGDALAEAVLLQNIKNYDKGLYAHVVDVAALSALVGVQLELDRDLLEWMILGALLHDVGLIRLPRNLVHKKGNLPVDEEKLFRKHPEIGWTMLRESQNIPEESGRIVMEHHERQDGSGYPNGLREDSISVLSGLVGMIDQFDELVTSWGSGTPIPSAMAIRSLFHEAKAGKLSQGPVEAMIKCLGVYPVGSLVQLATAERAIVLKGNSTDRLKPLVRIVTDSLGKPSPSPLVVDLAEAGSETQERAIISVLDPSKYKLDVSCILEQV